jgi:predicted DNA-binding transcriptional regulator AlpA
MDYIGTFEVIKILNIKTRNTIYRWMSLGKFLTPYVDKHGYFLWSKGEVEAWKQKQLQKGIIL